MTSAKLNQAIIRSVMDALARARNDPFLADPTPPSVGPFASHEEATDAQRAPAHIIDLLRIRAEKGEALSGEQLRRFVQKEVWSRSFHMSKAMIGLDLASGSSPKRHVQEAREAIDALARMGEPEAQWFTGFLKKAIGEE